jgi:hypothetical protein
MSLCFKIPLELLFGPNKNITWRRFYGLDKQNLSDEQELNDFIA